MRGHQPFGEDAISSVRFNLILYMNEKENNNSPLPWVRFDYPSSSEDKLFKRLVRVTKMTETYIEGFEYHRDITITNEGIRKILEKDTIDKTNTNFKRFSLNKITNGVFLISFGE